MRWRVVSPAIGKTFFFVVQANAGFTANDVIAKILNDNKWNLPAFPDKSGKIKGLIHGGPAPGIQISGEFERR